MFITFFLIFLPSSILIRLCSGRCPVVSRAAPSTLVKLDIYLRARSMSRLLNTSHLAFVAHGLYYYLVTNYANPSALMHPVW